MAAGDILNLNNSIGPRLIRILYCIALVLITIGVVHGIIGGVHTMMRPAPPEAAVAGAPADQAAPAPQGPPPQMSQMMRRPGPGFGPRHFRRGPGARGMMRGPLMFDMHGLSPVVQGSLRILITLIRGFIILLVVRVLAEIGTAILAMGAKRA